MKIECASMKNGMVSFSGISLTKGVNAIKKSGIANSLTKRSELPNAKVKNVLSGPYGHPHTGGDRGGGGGVATDIELPNVVDLLKQSKNILLGRPEYYGIETSAERALKKAANANANGGVGAEPTIIDSVGESISHTVKGLWDLVTDWS